MPKEPKKERRTTTRRATPRKVTSVVRKPRTKKVATAGAPYEHIETRAYFLHLEEPWADPNENWLRAERELATA